MATKQSEQPDTPKAVSQDFQIKLRYTGEYEASIADILKKAHTPEKLSLLLEVLYARLQQLPTATEYAKTLLHAVPDLPTKDLWEIVHSIQSGALDWDEAVQEAEARIAYIP
jgi:hypothetical protein